MPTGSYPVPLQPVGGGGLSSHPSGGAVVARGISAPGPGGQVIDVDVRQVIPKRKIAQRIVESLPIVGTGVSAALLIKDLLDASRVMEGPGGTVVMDPGEPQSMQLVWKRELSEAECARSDAGAALQCVIASLTPQGACNYSPVSCTGNPADRCTQSAAHMRWVNVGNGNQELRCQPSTGFTVAVDTGNGLACPPGQVISFWADDWCTTAPETWPPVPVEDATDRVEQKIAPGAAPELLKELDGQGIGVGGDLPSVQGPSAIHTGRETTNNPDGSTTVKDTSSDIRYGPQQDPQGFQRPGWEWNTREEVRTYPPGQPIPAPGVDTTPPNGGGTVTENPGGGSGLEDLITCGLPWTPACKIDETGTPQAPTKDPASEVQGVMADLSQCLASPASCLPTLPDLSWSFELPTGCTAFSVPGFDFMEPLDICQWQPMFHDLMSMIWLAAGLFGGLRMVNREMFGAA